MTPGPADEDNTVNGASQLDEQWQRRSISSGAPLEGVYGYCRAVRAGSVIQVAGTAPIWPDGTVDPDPGAQARRCLEIIARALSELGSSVQDVVRTRMYVTDETVVDAAGRAHGAVFGHIRPVSTMVIVAGLLDPRWKIEIEAEAIAGSGSVSPRED